MDYYCVACGIRLVLDNCDVDRLGSTVETRCDDCGGWFCNDGCGDEKNSVCAPCIASNRIERSVA